MKQQPIAVCTVCGHFTYELSLMSGGKCSQSPGGKRCRGTYRSANNVGDWAQCAYCVDGRADGNRCEVCQGSGWNYVRK